MRIIFCGTPEYAVPSLKRLAALAPRHEVVGVVSQPDRPKGRSGVPTPPPVVEAACALGIPAERIFQPRSINNSRALQALKALTPDLLCVIAYGNILKAEALALPKVLAINAHASLLPKYRGAAPIQAALLAGEAETGVCVIKMEAALDAGPVLLRRSIPIGRGDDGGTLHDKLAELSADCFVEAIGLIESGRCELTPQDASQVTYAPKLEKASGQIDWNKDAAAIERLVRAMTPWPGAWTEVSALDGKQRLRLRVAKAVLADGVALAACPPVGRGSVAGHGDEASFLVGCSNGALRILRVQPEGKREMSAAEFLRGAGKNFSPGSNWGAAG